MCTGKDRLKKQQEMRDIEMSNAMYATKGSGDQQLGSVEKKETRA
eukprot:CAMPEP_0170475698 /NCGR_PEP_ID=MMETSP0123-20130129/17296_1 /TAXON_ID=182087 /ORGANISM="Favella ehrenbergii, Strain Fehren 1" /LENGTH=44 /DNA_ID= /DNA_START= /DNA_END= /DNA_ORIENTATION=